MGQLLEAPADPGHLLGAVDLPGLRLDKLQVVDVHDLVPVSQGVCLDVLGRHTAGLNELQLPGPDSVRPVGQALPLLPGDLVALDGGHLDPRQVGHQAVGQLVLVGLQRVESNPPVFGLVVGHGHRQGRFARRGVAPQYHHVPHLRISARVNLGQAPGHVLHRRPTVPVRKDQQHLGHVHALDTPPLHQQLVELGDVAPGPIQVPGRLEQAAQFGHLGHPGLLPHEGSVLPHIGRRGRQVHELQQVLRPAVPVFASQPAPNGHRVGGPALGVQAADGLKHHAALGRQEVLGSDPLQSLSHQGRVDEQGPQHRHLGGQPPVLLYHVGTSSRATSVGAEGSPAEGRDLSSSFQRRLFSQVDA